MAESSAPPIPLVAVPYMGAVGQDLCAKAGIGWLDLSGNAHIDVPGFRIHVEGKPNLFKRRGRPENAFAPKSARVTRHLLLHPDRSWTQKEIAAATGLTETYAGRIVHKLEADRLLLRDDSGAVRPRDPDLLLDAWVERYDFSKHQILAGHISATTTDELLRTLVQAFEASKVPYAATALPAAWLRDQHARYRITSIYLEHQPSKEQLDALHFREGDRGANLWLVVPNDTGVFQGAEQVAGIRCTSVIQTYLDLLHHAERAKEAAQFLRERHLRWVTS